MSENEKDENTLIESQENFEHGDKSFKQETDDKKGTEKDPSDLKTHSRELYTLLEKEKQKSLRLRADYQNLEKQTINRINTRGDKIILSFILYFAQRISIYYKNILIFFNLLCFFVVSFRTGHNYCCFITVRCICSILSCFHITYVIT